MYKKKGRKPKKPNKAIFETLYYNENMTARELSKHYGVTEQTILNWAYQFRKEKKMNEKIYNIGYEALTNIMELSEIILDSKLDEIQIYTLIKAINRISIQSKYMIFQEKEKEQ